MTSGAYVYLLILSTGSSFVSFLFSILAFLNLEGMRIEKGKNINSGVLLLVNSILFFIVAYFSKTKLSKQNKPEKRQINSSDQMLEMKIIDFF